MTNRINIRLGTGASQKAIRRGRLVKSQLRELGAKVKLVAVRTAPAEVWPNIVEDRAALTRRMQRALRKQKVDIACHCVSDLPTEMDEGLSLQAIGLRENAHDVLISGHFNSLAALPHGATIDAGNPERIAQILRCRSDLKISNVGGHFETRFKKMLDHHWDAMIVEYADLIQHEVNGQIICEFSETEMMPAIGQGAFALQTRRDDIPVIELVKLLNDEPSYSQVLAEREMLARLRTKCAAPIAAWSRVGGDNLRLEGAIFSSDGKKMLTAAATDRLGHMKSLGREVADKLLASGAARL